MTGTGRTNANPGSLRPATVGRAFRPRPSATRRRQRWGSVLLASGGVLGILLAVDVASGGEFALPGRGVPPALWAMLAAGLLAAGWHLLRTRRSDAWEPVFPGQRFHRLVLYTRKDCPLCDEALETLEEHRPWLPPIECIDVDTDETLRRRFDTQVPVVEIDGRIRFRGRVSRVLLRRLIVGTPPLAAEEREGRLPSRS